MERLEWGRTPWDDMPQVELLREMQRAYAAAVAARGVLAMVKAFDQGSPYWGIDGTGGRALAMLDQVVEGVERQYDHESLYRSFFRYATDLLFDQRGNRIGCGWAVCPKCGVMIGRSSSGASPIGELCRHGAQGCDGVLRPIIWKDLAPIAPDSETAA